MGKESAAVRREQLIAATIAVMTTEGIDAATTRRIAQEAGLTVGVVYYCFGTKENLYREVISAIVGELQVSVSDALRPGEDVRACLSKATEALFSAVEAYPERHLLTYELVTYALRQPAAIDLAKWQYSCYYEATERFFHEVAATAGIEWQIDVSTLGRMLAALNEGVTLAWLVDRDGTKARSIYAAWTDQLLGLAVPAETPLDHRHMTTTE